MGEPASPLEARLYPRVPPLLWVIGAIGVVVAGAMVVLNLGGPDEPFEARGDLIYIQGQARPNRQQGDLVASIADVIEAGVRREGDSLVFSARTSAALPQPLKISALQFRWDIAVDGSTWTVTATVEETTEATVFSSTGFGVATADETLPGAVTIDEDTIEIDVNTAQLPDFPTSFDWSLTTTLRAFRNEPDSPRVEDRYPDEGTIPLRSAQP